LRPDWPSALIRDYIAFKRNVFIAAETSAETSDRLDAIEIRLGLIEAAIVALDLRLTYLEGSIVVTAIDVAASGNTTIICTDSLTVTLAATPLDKDLVSIKAINGDKIIINGNGNTIEGDDTLTIRRNKKSTVKTGLTMRYSASLNTWVLI
jgi:hypothetical protein